MSIPFLAFPRFLLFLSSTGEGGEHREYKLTPLESFLSTHFAILALSMAVGIINSVSYSRKMSYVLQIDACLEE
jgi:hypothetical protein